METISFKLQENILKKVDKFLELFNFSTRTEFIREAIREKLEKLDTKVFMAKLSEYKGSAKTSISDKELEKIREAVFNSISK